MILPVEPSLVTTFASYLSALEEWDYAILQDINILEPIHVLAQYYSQLSSQTMYTMNDTTMAMHAGPAFSNVTSFQSEGYGLLSVT
eukprot:10098971-Ditylum_brightwellii.AAC.1